MNNSLLSTSLTLFSSERILSSLHSSKENLNESFNQAKNALSAVKKHNVSKSMLCYLNKTNNKIATECLLPDARSIPYVTHKHSSEQLLTIQNLQERLRFCCEGLMSWLTSVSDEVGIYFNVIRERIDLLISKTTEQLNTTIAIDDSTFDDISVDQSKQTYIIPFKNMKCLLTTSVDLLKNLIAIDLVKFHNDPEYRVSSANNVNVVVNQLTEINGTMLTDNNTVTTDSPNLNSDYIQPSVTATLSEQGYTKENITELLTLCISGLECIKTISEDPTYVNCLNKLPEDIVHVSEPIQTPSQDIISEVITTSTENNIDESVDPEQTVNIVNGNDPQQDEIVTDGKPVDYSVADNDGVISEQESTVLITDYAQNYAKLLILLCDNVINSTMTLLTIA